MQVFSLDNSHILIFFTGYVFVGLKESVFEPSSPFRHMSELYSVISDPSFSSKPIVFLYTDGGPDHRLTYISVQLSLISLFLKLDLDYLCACRTAPYHSWRNPVERVMAVLNLGLQCVGLARAEFPVPLEEEVSKCNTLSELRKIAAKTDGFPLAVQDSLSPVKVLLSSIFCRLKLHNEAIQMFSSASSTQMSDFWTTLLSIDSSLKEEVQYTKKNFAQCTKAVEFISHCCRSSHYSFDILKCGVATCGICKPIRLAEDIFKKLKHIPHPTPGADDHYTPFIDPFGKPTTEEHRPSLKQKSAKKNSLPFYASVQHVKNADMMMQCDECMMWRLIYSKYKLKNNQKIKLQRILDDFVYTCGSKLSELGLSEEFKDVEVREHLCGQPIEKLYYSANLDPICVYCAKEYPYTSEDTYPQCTDCSEKPPVSRK